MQEQLATGQPFSILTLRTKKNKVKIWQSVKAWKFLIPYTKKGEEKDRCFLFSLNCFQPFFMCCCGKKSIYTLTMFSNLPPRLEPHWKFLPVYLLPRFQFHELDSLWINLNFLKMNYSDIHFSALQSWTATLCSW